MTGPGTAHLEYLEEQRRRQRGWAEEPMPERNPELEELEEDEDEEDAE